MNPLDQKETLKQLRKSWADECNQYLDEANKIDHRSYEERGIDQIPAIHEGPIARWIEEKRGISEKCQRNRDIRKTNQEIKELNRQIEEIDAQKKELQERINEIEKETIELKSKKEEGIILSIITMEA